MQLFDSVENDTVSVSHQGVYNCKNKEVVGSKTQVTYKTFALGQN